MIILAVVAGVLCAITIFAGWTNYTQQYRTRSRWLFARDVLRMTDAQVIGASQCAVLAYTQRHDREFAKLGRETANHFWRLALPLRLQSIGGSLVRTYNASSVDCMLVDFGSHRVLAIRGTEGITDIISDLLTLPVKGPLAGMVHGGFSRAATIVYQEFRADLESGTPVIIAGHSLGAAIAQHIAADMLMADGDETLLGVVALCSPRLGTKPFAKVLTILAKDRLLRVTYSRDFVAMLPPWPFRHAGQTHYFDALGEYHPHLTAMYRAIDIVGSVARDVISGRFLIGSLAFHSAATVATMIERDIARFKLSEQEAK